MPLQSPAATTFKYAIVGDDTSDNFRLAEILRRIRGRELVGRFLSLDHFEPFIRRHADEPLIVFLDLFGFDLVEATDFIGHIRETYPRAVFSLYVDKSEFETRIDELPEQWRRRLGHYYKLYKEDDAEIAFEPMVRATLGTTEWEANYNASHEPIRLTPLFKRGLSGLDETVEDPSDRNITFVSYARHDWHGFVSAFVSNAGSSHRLWIDQNYLVGGDDWMDAIGQALQVCESLLLIVSPESIKSKYVKMEYRYFFKQEKPIIPILYKEVEHIPFELATLNHIDFTRPDVATSYRELAQVLAKRPRRKPH